MFYAIVGLILVAFGLLSLLTGSWTLVLIQLLPGLACWVYAVASHLPELRERLGGQAGRRGIWFGSNALVQTVALAVILGLIAFLATRHAIHWDWTESGIHTLTGASREVLAQIPEGDKIEILGFFTDPRSAQETLDLYDYASNRLSYRMVDPRKSPVLARKLEVFVDGALVICRGTCETAKATVKTTELSEDKITEAIRSVVSERRKVYFVTGHDEAQLENEKADGLSRIAGALEAENIAHDTLLLAQTNQIPDDADALVIASPSFGFFEREATLLDGYLRAGGSLLLMADALQDAKLDSTLEGWSIRLGKDLVVDQQLQLFGPPRLSLEPLASDYGEHPVTEKMRGQLTLFQLARSVEPLEAEDSGTVVKLVETAPESWAVPADGVEVGSKIELDPEVDRPGPISLAVARTFERIEDVSTANDDASTDEASESNAPKKPGREGRLVVVGDSDFARNRYVAEGANADLFLNMVNWLVGEESFITIDRRLPRASRVEMTPDQVRLFSYLGVFLIPEGILLLGVAGWWRRRQV